MLEHLARDHEVEAVVTDGQAARVPDNSPAAGAGHRAGDQPRPDVEADQGGAARRRRRGERAIAAAGVERSPRRETDSPQALVEHDAQTSAHVGGMAEALEATGDALVERFARRARHRSRPSSGSAAASGSAADSGVARWTERTR